MAAQELIKRGDLRNLAWLIDEVVYWRNRDVDRMLQSAEKDADIVKAKALVKRLRLALNSGLDNVFWDPPIGGE